MVIPENIHEKQRLDLAKEQLAQTEELKEWTQKELIIVQERINGTKSSGGCSCLLNFLR